MQIQNNFLNSSEKPALHAVIQALLEKRGSTGQDIQQFLSWSLKDLPDLTKLLDLEKAALRIIQAIKSQEKICVYGDYDVDGTTSCSLLYHFFKSMGTEIETLQPSRFNEGYGLHLCSIDEAVNREVKVLITVDCGITSHDAAEYALERGVDLIITDHHADKSDELPCAFATVNPNRRDEPLNSPLRPLAGVGVAFALALQIKKFWEKDNPELASLYPLLQLVAVGTISDLAPINYVNARLIKHGLKQLPKSLYPGLRQFLDQEERKLNFTPSEKISFQIGPLINSKGRLDHPEIALKLLNSADSDEANLCHNTLVESNRERKIIQAQVFKEAKTQFLNDFLMKGISMPPIAVVYKPDWHEGVIGIVASKIVEEFRIPAIIFTDSKESGLIKASARTAGELDLFAVLNSQRHLFEKFGGHKAAAGLSMKAENLKNLKEQLYAELIEVPEILRTKSLDFDLDIDFNQIDFKLVNDLQVLEPFGNLNPKPMFKIQKFKIDSYDELKGGHVRWNISCSQGSNKNIKAISFSYIGKWEHIHPQELMQMQDQGESLCLIGQLGFNQFRGNKFLQILVSKIQMA